MFKDYNNNTGISILMPTYNQGAFISRSIESLLLQTFTNWELIIVNDGSTDYTKDVLCDYLTDTRFKYYENEKNEGLGYCLNKATRHATHQLIAYLPSDDIYFKNHLQKLYDIINNEEHCIFAYSGVAYNSQNNKLGDTDKCTLSSVNGIFQLVQVLHKNTGLKWLERQSLVTDDLNVMFWNKLFDNFKSVSTNTVTCEWVSHPEQRHKFIKETLGGGIYKYKNHYGVTEPIKFQSSAGNFIDEIEVYKKFRLPHQLDKYVSQPQRLKILLVGELAYNAERICALEEYGHKLYGLWITMPEFYNAIGPLPFGNIENIPLANWKEKIKEINPDVIYGLLNFQAIPLAHYILTSNTGIPFVWHFKEGPFFARKNGLWKQLLELYTNSDGQIFINKECQDWFSQFLSLKTPSLILDGDLPKRDWFIEKRDTVLSDVDGEIHTVVPGRPLGIDPNRLASFATQKIHFHFYGDFYHTTWRQWIQTAQDAAPNYIHIHPNCSSDRWKTELGKYDAGWLHIFDSQNEGELIKATWNDLNYPARMSTLAAAGLPMVQKSNVNHIVAAQNIVKQLDIGYFFDEIENLKDCFGDLDRRNEIRQNAWENRYFFSFDYHVKDLTNFFHTVIQDFKSRNTLTGDKSTNRIK